MLEILEKLISFKTTENNPEEIKKGFEYISSLFSEDAFDVQMFEKNGKLSQLISFKGRDALHPRVLLNGHFDVVPAEGNDQYQMRQEEDKLIGRGTLDMKGMVAVLIEIMLELGEKDVVSNVALLLNSDEEIGGANGAGYMVHEVGLSPDFVICPDGGGSFESLIVNKEKGILWLELVAKGKTAHGAYVWKGENAIEKIVDAIEKIKDFIGPVEPDAWKTTVNVGVIETTNTTPNKVPADAKALLDIRFTEESAKGPKELEKKIRNLAPEVEVRVIESSGLFFVEEENELLQAFKKATEDTVGKEVGYGYAHGAADIRYFGEKGIPGALFGSLGEGMHADGEWVSLKSLEENKMSILKFLESVKT